MSIVQTQTVHIGAVIRNAVAFQPNRKLGEAVRVETLLQTVNRLFALLAERHIEYVLVGGIALLRYVEGRNTEDIDLIMALPSLKQMPEIEIVEQDLYFARGKFDDLQIDVLLTHNPLFDKVRRQYAATQPFVERDIPCASVEGLLLLKLYAVPSLYRQEDFGRVGIYENDIATLLQAYRPPLEPLLAELALHLNASDLAAVQEVLVEIQERIQRFGKGFGKDA